MMNKENLSDEQYYQILKELVNSRPHNWVNILYCKNYKYIKDWIISKTLFLDPKLNYKLSQRVWHIFNNKYKPHECPICHKQIFDPKMFAKLNCGYAKATCGNLLCKKEHQNQQRILTNIKIHGIPNYNNREKAKQTCLKSLGVENPSQCLKVQKQKEETCFKNHGVKCGFQSEEVKKKSKITKKERYGDENYTNPEKRKQTCLKVYGCEYPTQNEEVQKQIKQTKKERYNDENYVNVKKCKQTKEERYNNPNYNNREKFVKTCNEKYNCDNVFQVKEIYNKGVKTCYEKYGVSNGGASDVAQEKIKRKYFYNEIYFDSAPEIAYYIWLTDHNIKFEYQPKYYFKYVDTLGKEHRYYPDFYLIETNEYVEIKGDHFFNESGRMICPYDRSKDREFETKHQCMLQNNIKILKENKYKIYLDYVNQKYGKDYLKQFKKVKN